MVQRIGPEEVNVTLKFGGGLHTRASPDQISTTEAANGQNFMIDIQDRNLTARPPFDLIGTVPNAQPIKGGATLLTPSGTVSSLIQAGSEVYQWNAGNTFTAKGTCSSSCQLRGHWFSHNWNLTPPVVLITDLSLTDPIYQWDGTTLSKPTFVDQANNPFGTFKAKYLSINNARAVFANVADASGNLPHLIVGCKTSDYLEITTVNVPSSALGTGDPFFIPMPDLKPVNSYLQSYLGTMLSTQSGAIWNLNGTDATNFALATFYANSAAIGFESVCEIGNDFIYGRQGRIESVRDTQTFGNSVASDLTAIISDQVATYTAWTIVFNSRTRKAYCFPTGVSQCWVMDCAIRDQNESLASELGESGSISPWMKWTTSHSMAFLPTFVMSMLDPNDGLEYIIMGDSSGNVYRMEGTGANGDGGTNPIDMQFLSKLISGRLDAKAYDIEGYVKYEQNLAATCTLTFQYQGENIFNVPVTVSLAAASGASYYSNNAYYNDDFYYSTFKGKLSRAKFEAPGNNNEFQVLVEVSGNNAVSINEIGIRFRETSQ